MSTSLPLSILLVMAIGAAQTEAQNRIRSERPIAVQAALGDGRISGVVLDEAGAGVAGVNILATGTTLAVARSDSGGRFNLVLPVGEYLLHATRDGYLSTYREPVRVEPNRHLQRRIRLIRSVAFASTSAQPPEQTAPATATPEEMHGHGEMAWRLRHLKRSVLRDVAPTLVIDEPSSAFDGRPVTMGSWVDRAIGQTARGASSFFTETDFSGHINLLATSALAGPSREVPGDWSRGIANVSLSAPVGQGDWSIRGAMAAGDASSWTLLGEYTAHDDQRHAVRLAVSYGTQGFTPLGELSQPTGLPESRSVGGFAASDRWQVRPSVVLDYGVRFEHYDYLSEPGLVSPRAGLGVEVRRGSVIRASTAQRSIAPGADDFLPPSSSGPWLPPMRTFRSLVPEAAIQPERVRRHAVGLDQELGTGGEGRLTLEWFTEDTDNQMATLFGLDGQVENAPYYVGSVGDVEVTGWRVGLEGTIAPNVNGRVEYTEGKARWNGARAATRLREINPVVARRGRENVSDLRGRLTVLVPASSTHLVVGYQLTHLDPVSARGRSLTDDALDLELRQKLPYQPLTAGLLQVVFTLSTLHHQHEAGSLYDEVLTSEAPARVTAGIQVGF